MFPLKIYNTQEGQASYRRFESNQFETHFNNFKETSLSHYNISEAGASYPIRDKDSQMCLCQSQDMLENKINEVGNYAHFIQ